MTFNVSSTETGQAVFCIGIALYLFMCSADCQFKKLLAKKDDRQGNEISVKPLVVTRVHMKSASRMPDADKIVAFVKNSKLYAEEILVCIGADEYKLIETYKERVLDLLTKEGISSGVTLLPVSPWGYFTTSLNAAVQYAQDKKIDYIAFQSLEFTISHSHVAKLLQQFRDKRVIMVGPELEGHVFAEGVNKLTGRTCPWNTFAMWNTNILGMTGFPIIGDGYTDARNIGGVEELSTVTLLQKINPSYRALLVRLPGDKTHLWDIQFADPQRQEYHTKKMQSKDQRPAAQMRLLGIDSGTVIHVIGDV